MGWCRFCIRLHEKHQDDKGYTDAPKKFGGHCATEFVSVTAPFSECRLDPNDKGNDHGRKNRDWL